MLTSALRGSFVALVTPMHDDGSLALDALDGLVDAHLAAGSAGLVVAGTTGESASLSIEELRDLVAYTVERVAGRCPVIAGAGAPSTARAVALGRAAQAAGADALLCVTPYYLRTTQAGLLAHYRQLADAVPGPMILYNVPGRTGVDLLPETVGVLSELTSVVAVKEAVAGAERVTALRQHAGNDFVVMSGDDASCREAMAAGATGVISVTANLVPAPMAELCRLVQAGEMAAAEALDRRLASLHELLMAEPNPIPVKWALARLGRIPRGLRLPLVPPSDELVQRLAGALDALGDGLLEPIASVGERD